jgi:hypothetical protein
MSADSCPVNATEPTTTGARHGMRLLRGLLATILVGGTAMVVAHGPFAAVKVSQWPQPTSDAR